MYVRGIFDTLIYYFKFFSHKIHSYVFVVKMCNNTYLRVYTGVFVLLVLFSNRLPLHTILSLEELIN